MSQQLFSVVLPYRGAHVDTARGDQHVADGIDVVHAGPLQLVVQQLPVLGVGRHAHTLQPDLGCARVHVLNSSTNSVP